MEGEARELAEMQIVYFNADIQAAIARDRGFSTLNHIQRRIDDNRKMLGS